MTDYDRGAYTPQTDAPLAFDPRRPSERRPMPMALIGSAAVLVILLAGVAMVYRGGVRHAGDSPRPVGEPVMAVKTAPTAAQTAANATAAASTPSPAADLYSQSQPAPSAPPSTAQANTTAAPAGAQVAEAPTFTAPSEQPAARPTPSAATVAMLAKPSAPTHIVRPPTPVEQSVQTAAAPAKPIVHKTTTTAVKTQTASTTPAKAVIAPVLRPAVHPKVDDTELAAAGATRVAAANDAPVSATTPHKAKAAGPASAPPATTPAGTATAPTATAEAKGSAAKPGSAVVQIGAFSSSALADKGYADVSSAMPDQIGGKAKHVQPLDKDGKTLYRTWLSGFTSRADAVAFCEALKAKGKTCLVKG